ncbi:FG-GAP repeat domain-containing protein [Pontibacter sp. CAU 1760]
MRLSILIVALLLVSWGCSDKARKQQLANERVSVQPAALPDTTATHNLTGLQLAQAYCRACHAFPDPSLLDKETWQKGVLPQMALRLGLNRTGESVYLNRPAEDVTALLTAGVFPEQPLITAKDFEKIEAYYLAHAPEQLSIPPSQPLAPDLTRFSVIIPSLNKGKPALTTLVQYEPGKKELWVGDLRNWLYRLDAQLQVKDSLQLPSAPVDVMQHQTSIHVLTIGVMDPSDLQKGQLVELDATPRNQHKVLLNGLRRPVDMVHADLDKDQFEDIVVCNYGNNIGTLVWYRNLGKGRYEPRILKALPGARKVEVTDLDKDGLDDLVVLFAQGTEAIKVFYNRGKGRFQERNLLQFPPVYGLSYFELADFNQDGFPDIVLTTGDNADHSPVLKPYHGIHIYLNDGKQNFKEAYLYPMPGASKVLARDFDQDGDLDLAAIAFFPDFKNGPERGFVYLQQEKGLTFSASTFAQSQVGHWLTLEAADYDQDKDLDIILGSFTYTPAPPAQQQKWRKEGPSLLILNNQLK